jgi:hypothetical protein
MQTGQPRSAFTTRPALDSWRQPWRGVASSPVPRESRVLAPLKTGAGQPLLVFPMFGAGPESTARLRDALARAGFHCHDWGHGRDEGPHSGSLRQRLRRLEEGIIDIFEAEREPVTLVGWGFSGLYARELAKHATPLVRQVITLGTPFNTGAGQCAMLRPLLDDSGRLPLAVQQQLRERPPVPCTSIYSMSDALVPWPMCIEPPSPASESIMVPALGHRALADHPQVRRIIADRLAQRAGSWQPYAA